MIDLNDGTVSTPTAADHLAMLMTATGARAVKPAVVANDSSTEVTVPELTPARQLDDVAVDRLFALQAKASVTATGSTTSLDQPWWSTLEV